MNCEITSLVLAVTALLVGVVFLPCSLLRILPFSDIFLIVGVVCLGLALILFCGIGCVQCLRGRFVRKIEDEKDIEFLKKEQERESLKREASRQTELKHFLDELEKENISLNFSQIDEQDISRIRDIAIEIRNETSERLALCGEVLKDISNESDQLCHWISYQMSITPKKILEKLGDFPTLRQLKILSDQQDGDESVLTKLEYYLEELKKELKFPLDFSQIDADRLQQIQSATVKISSETSERKKLCKGILTQVCNECSLLQKVISDKKLSTSEGILEELKNFETLSDLRCLTKLVESDKKILRRKKISVAVLQGLRNKSLELEEVKELSLAQLHALSLEELCE